MTNTTNNNLSKPRNSPSATVLSNFGVYQQNLVGSSNISIRTLVSDAINAEPYRKALITQKKSLDPEPIWYSFRLIL